MKVGEGGAKTENPYLEMLKKAQSDSTSITTTESLKDYGLDNVDCDICGNTGYLVWQEDGIAYSKECECMAKRRSLRRIQTSGLSEMLSRYTFDAYEVPDAKRLQIKHLAKRFAEDDSGWFYLSGQSGSGKTHICTAICARLIERGKNVYYMKWRDESRQLKALMNTEEVEKPLDRLKEIPVLYIDDFFKGGCGDADLRLAFEIINARYNDSRLRTVISSEMTIEQVLSADEALGGRIYERSRGYILSAPSENWRIK